LGNAAMLSLSVVFLAGGFLFGRDALAGRRLPRYMVEYYASLFFGLYLVTRVVAPGELAGVHAPNDAVDLDGSYFRLGLVLRGRLRAPLEGARAYALMKADASWCGRGIRDARVPRPFIYRPVAPALTKDTLTRPISSRDWLSSTRRADEARAASVRLFAVSGNEISSSTRPAR
jgi:hypothetical protein